MFVRISKPSLLLNLLWRYGLTKISKSAQGYKDLLKIPCMFGYEAQTQKCGKDTTSGENLEYSMTHSFRSSYKLFSFNKLI